MNKSEEGSQIIISADFMATTVRDDLYKNPSPPYLKLIDDCWEHIFSFLSCGDIIAMGQTCKKMCEMAGHYILVYHPELEFDLNERAIQLLFSSVSIQTDFYKFIAKLCINYSSRLDFFQNSEPFHSLKTFAFDFYHFKENQIERMQNVLQNIETIVLEYCKTDGNTFEQLAVHCPKLEYLNVYYCHNINRELDTLFSQHFSMLKRLKLRVQKSGAVICIDKLKMFLEKHTNLKQLDIDCHFLWENRDALMQAEIRLDLLSICFDVTRITIPFAELVVFLKTLNARGFYKTLQIPFYRNPMNVDREHLNNALCTLGPVLENLLISYESRINLTRLTDLKQLHITVKSPSSVEIECIAKSLTNLERLYFTIIQTNQILPFIRHSKRLKTIKFHNLSEYILDAFALNQERKKFGNEGLVTIYMPNYIYLRSKWKPRNSKLNLIQIKCSDTKDYYFGW